LSLAPTPSVAPSGENLTSLIPLFASLISVSSWKDMGAWSRVEKRKGVKRRKRTIGRRMTVQRKKKGMRKEVTRRMSREWIKEERRDIWELKVIVQRKSTIWVKWVIGMK
jgi:hypothetical protein